MEISNQDYDRILEKQSARELAILIDVSGWRKFLVHRSLDEPKFTAL